MYADQTNVTPTELEASIRELNVDTLTLTDLTPSGRHHLDLLTFEERKEILVPHLSFCRDVDITSWGAGKPGANYFFHFPTYNPSQFLDRKEWRFCGWNEQYEPFIHYWKVSAKSDVELETAYEQIGLYRQDMTRVATRLVEAQAEILVRSKNERLTREAARDEVFCRWEKENGFTCEVVNYPLNAKRLKNLLSQGRTFVDLGMINTAHEAITHRLQTHIDLREFNFRPERLRDRSGNQVGYREVYESIASERFEYRAQYTKPPEENIVWRLLNDGLFKNMTSPYFFVANKEYWPGLGDWSKF